MNEVRKVQLKPMATYDACQWFRNGDHPEDSCELIKLENGTQFESEGRVVRYYRHPDDHGLRVCVECGAMMHGHGWIDDPLLSQREATVCPGDWILRGADGHYFAVSLKPFERLYESVAEI